MKKILLIFLSIILLTSIVFAIGVSYPMPSYFQLYPGQSANYVMSLQTGDSPAIFTFSIQEDSILDVTLPPETQVDANQRIRVAGSVYVPENTPAGIYTEKICAKVCEGMFCFNSCNLPITVEVLSFDQDNDGVIDEEDKCPDTIEEQLVYGCSCSQILALKPGEDTLENRQGCSKGIIEVFTKAIGWSKDLFPEN